VVVPNNFYQEVFVNLINNKILWIGGSSCSGKSSCAKLISEKHNLLLYNTDNFAFGKYMFQLEDESKYPSIAKYKNILLKGLDDFIKINSDDLLLDFLNYCYEIFPFLLNDIKILLKDNHVLVEGAHILPELIKDYSSANTRIFLISTKEQQRKIWLKEMSSQIPGGHPEEIDNFNKSKNKKQIEEKRVEFHNHIAMHIKKQCQINNYKHLDIDDNVKRENVESDIVNHFTLA
jgi:hypothetical protein